jgi:hypothetical protein
LTADQGDQIWRNFAQWVIVYLGLFGLLFQQLRLGIKIGKKWVGLPTFWAIFLQLHLVTLPLALCSGAKFSTLRVLLPELCSMFLSQNVRKIFQVDINYINIFQSQTFTQMGVLVGK